MEFEVPVTVHLNPMQLRKALVALNLHYLGRSEFKDLNEKATKVHEDSHWAVHRSRKISLKVGLTVDGDLEIL